MGGLIEPLARVSDMLQYFEKALLSVEAFDLLDKMRYNLWVVLLLEACDVTRHGRHLSTHLGSLFQAFR